MRAYKVETIEGFEATIFADNFETAASIFCIHHETYMDRMPKDFTVVMMRRPKPVMKRNYLADALALDVEGVGYFMSGRGWTIVPADHITR
jgi:hypothetical protein